MLSEMLLALNLHTMQMRAGNDASGTPIEQNGHYVIDRAALTPDPRVASRFKERTLYRIPWNYVPDSFRPYSEKIEVKPVSRRHCRFYSRRGD